MRDAQERLAQENSTLRAQLMETEAALLAEQEAVADLKHALAAADRRHATPLKADQAVQVCAGTHSQYTAASHARGWPRTAGCDVQACCSWNGAYRCWATEFPGLCCEHLELLSEDRFCMHAGVAKLAKDAGT